jgi:hypothetical protein
MSYDFIPISAMLVPNQAGVKQYKTINVTSAANAGAVLLGTVAGQAVLIKSITLKSNGVTTADFTSGAITGGAAGAVTFIDNLTAILANLAAADNQVSWNGSVQLDVADTINITLVGVGATAVNFTITIEYEAVVNGGQLS